MRITCPNCGAQYEVDAEDISFAGQDVQCSECFTIWLQKRDGSTERVRSSEGLVGDQPAEAAKIAETMNEDDAGAASAKSGEWSEIANIVREISTETGEEKGAAEPAPADEVEPEEAAPSAPADEGEPEVTMPPAAANQPAGPAEADSDLRAIFRSDAPEDEEPAPQGTDAEATTSEDEAGWHFEESAAADEPEEEPAEETEEAEAISAEAREKPDEDVDFEDFVWKEPKPDTAPDEEELRASITAAMAGQGFDSIKAPDKLGELGHGGKAQEPVIDDLNDDILRAELRAQIEAEEMPDGGPIKRHRLPSEMPAAQVAVKKPEPDEDGLKTSLRSSRVAFDDEDKALLRPRRRFRLGFYLALLVFALAAAAYFLQAQIVQAYPPAEPYMARFMVAAELFREYALVAGAKLVDLALQAWDWGQAQFDKFMAPPPV